MFLIVVVFHNFIQLTNFFLEVFVKSSSKSHSHLILTSKSWSHAISLRLACFFKSKTSHEIIIHLFAYLWTFTVLYWILNLCVSHLLKIDFKFGFEFFKQLLGIKSLQQSYQLNLIQFEHAHNNSYVFYRFAHNKKLYHNSSKLLSVILV